MKVKIYSNKKLKEVKYFTSSSFKDSRGEIWTTWDNVYSSKLRFNLDKFTTSKKSVLRGFHCDTKSWKLVTCIRGKILSVIVDYRPKSKNYLKFTSIIMSDKNKKSVKFLKDYIKNYDELNIQENMTAAIIIPDKDIIPGAETLSPAYIVFENYEKILNWNRSLRFALAVCTLKENFKNEI